MINKLKIWIQKIQKYIKWMIFALQAMVNLDKNSNLIVNLHLPMKNLMFWRLIAIVLNKKEF